MTYRDRNLVCVHCGAVLERPGRRDTWNCKQCKAVAIQLDDLRRLLARYSPEEPTFAPREVTRPPRICPACNDQMTAMTLSGVPIDQCTKDRLVWFDPEELESAITAVLAEHDSRRGWAERFWDLFYAN